MPQIELHQMVKAVSIKTLVSGDKQGRITLETVNEGDERALAVLSDKVMVKVTYEYENDENQGD